jgi:hypothetical protein
MKPHRARFECDEDRRGRDRLAGPGGDIVVYVEASHRSEAQGAASMKIELQGGIALTAANFTHF